ncbi:redoxin family protein [Actinoplanes sp. CA-030573]|uniref:redoxin family protein n=1 Tax=Actinoplanes sp. CA-030573 TaxID=3239898 RepID=UPI003D908036
MTAHRSARLPVEGHLPAFDGATTWLNSPPLTPGGLRGKVVLVNFWTYTCVNWLRQLPYVREWSRRYAAAGLVVVGVHTPEFPFEHDQANVRREVAARGVGWPVPMDNDYAIWTAFANHYWPALYLADTEGRIRYHHFGEGEYGRTELVLQELLGSSSHHLVTVEASGAEVGADWGTLRSPENYAGYARAERFASPEGLDHDKPRRYSVPGRLGLNSWALDGDWTIGEQATTLNSAAGGVAYRFHARDLNVVMGAATPVRFRVRLDGAPPGEAAGGDLDPDGHGTAADRRLYQLLRQPGRVADRTAEITFLDPGAELYSFTFG